MWRTRLFNLLIDHDSGQERGRARPLQDKQAPPLQRFMSWGF